MDESVVKALIAFMYKKNMKSGERVSEYQFQTAFVEKLRRDQQGYAWDAVDALVERGVLERDGHIFGKRTFDLYKLTDKGVSALRAAITNVPKRTATINNFHITGQNNIQIGDNNVQHNNFSWNWDKVDEVLERQNGSEEQKKEAKSLLLKIAENPLLASFLTAIGGEAIKPFLG